MTFPVFSIPSDHTVITDHRDTDHIVTRGGEARKARKGSNDNRGEPGEHPRTQHPTHSSAQLRPQPSLDLDRDNLASYNMGGWPQAVSIGVTHDLVTHMPTTLRGSQHTTSTDQI